VGEGADVGEVAEISADGKTAVVIFGVVKIRSRFSDLRSARGRPLARPERREGIEMEKPTEVGRDLDLRGMTGEEALPLVDKFIDDAVLAGLHRIDIIHGKGTGALRKKISDFLTSHPRVRSFRLGEWNEGGTGATVVELGDS
jgi:DNA mismatch repair protein MutS2